MLYVSVRRGGELTDSALTDGGYLSAVLGFVEPAKFGYVKLSLRTSLNTQKHQTYRQVLGR